MFKKLLPVIPWGGRFCLALFIRVSLFLSVSFLYAGETEKTPQFYDSVVTTVDVPLSQSRVKEMASPVSLEVISLTESDREHNVSCADILANKSSGITVKNQGGIGSYADVSIRGTSAGRVGVYLDDIPLSSGNGTLFNMNSLSSALIGQVEVYKGNIPAGLGVSGTGGVIRLLTDKGKYGNDVILGLGGGSYGYGTATCQYNGCFPQTHIYSSGEFLTAKNDYPYQDGRGTAYNPDDDKISTQQNDAIQQINCLAGASHVLSTMGTISGMVFYNEGRKGLPGLPAAPTHTAYYYNQDVSGQLFYKSAPMGAVALRTGVVLRNNSYTTYYPMNELSQISGHNIHRRDRERLIKIQSDAVLNPRSGQTLSFFGDAAYEDFLPEDLTGQALVEALSASRYSGTGGIRYSLAGKFSETVFSGSAQGVRFKSGEGQNRNTFSFIPGKSEDRLFFSGSLSSIYRFKERIQLYTSANFLVQQPALYQLFGDKGASVSNPDLKPEKSLTGEWGLRYNQGISGCVLSGDLALFVNRMRDAIIMQRSYAQACWVNSDDALVYGVESDIRLQWRKLLLNLSWTFQKPENRTRSRNNDVYNGKMLPGQSKVNLSNELRWSPAPVLDLLYRFKHTSDYFTDLLNSDPVYRVPARFIHDAGLTIFPLSRWGISFTIENITDENAFDVYGFPTPGRIFYLKTTYQISLNKTKENP